MAGSYLPRKMLIILPILLIITTLTLDCSAAEQRIIKVLPDEELRKGSPEKGFRDKKGQLIPYNAIWEHEGGRDKAHKRYNRHLAREIEDISNEDTSLEKDMLIYVVLLIFLIIPYTGMVLCRKFCPQILHGGASAAEARAKREAEERARKSKHAENKAAEKAIVEIDLTKRKKEKTNQISQIAAPAKALVKFSHAQHRQQQFEKQQHQIEPVEERIVSSRSAGIQNNRKSNRNGPFYGVVRAQYRNAKVTPVDDNFLQQAKLAKHHGRDDISRKDSENFHFKPFKTTKIVNDPGFYEGAGDHIRAYSEFSRKSYAQRETQY